MTEKKKKSTLKEVKSKSNYENLHPKKESVYDRIKQYEGIFEGPPDLGSNKKKYLEEIFSV